MHTTVLVESYIFDSGSAHWHLFGLFQFSLIRLQRFGNNSYILQVNKNLKDNGSFRYTVECCIVTMEKAQMSVRYFSSKT